MYDEVSAAFDVSTDKREAYNPIPTSTICISGAVSQSRIYSQTEEIYPIELHFEHAACQRLLRP